MSQPPPYSPHADYSADVIPGNVGNALDIDFAAIALSIDATIDNLALLQKDDGSLRNGLVTPFSLSADTVAMLGDWTIRGDWATATQYAQFDFVSEDGAGYLCIVAHQSGVFANDFAAGYWTAISKTNSVASPYSLGLFAETDAAGWLTELGFSAYAQALSAVANAADFRTAIGAQALDAGLTSIAALTTAADRMIYTTALDVYAVTPLTAAARTLLDDAMVSDMRTTLELYEEGTVPQNIQSAAYTTVMADKGKHILHPAADNNARTWTIDSNANVPYPLGAVITFVNEINTITIGITADTMVLAGVGTTGNRTLAANGMATAIKITSTKWVISGSGLT